MDAKHDISCRALKLIGKLSNDTSFDDLE